MVNIHKDLEEEIALMGGIDKMMEFDERTSERMSCLSPTARQHFLKTPEQKQKDFDKAVEKEKAFNALADRKIQMMLDENYRRTKVRILGASDICELEDMTNEFIYDRERDSDARFRLIDIKYSAQNTTSEAMIIYSEIDKPEEPDETNP